MGYEVSEKNAFPHCFKLFVVLLLAMLSFSGCHLSSRVYEVEHNGKIFKVDQDQQIISFDDCICSFKISHSGKNTSLEVTYPDGSTFWKSREQYISVMGYSDDYDAEKYINGEVLWDVLDMNKQTGMNIYPKSMISVVLIVAGIIMAAFPRAIWYLGYGWRYKNAEPSCLAITAGRAGGVIAVIAGVILLFV